jgi:hypothetical protein
MLAVDCLHGIIRGVSLRGRPRQVPDALGGAFPRCCHPIRFLVLGFFVLMTTALTAQGQTQAPSPAGTWQGKWDSPNGSVYTAVVQLNVTSDGTVDGSISWTLKDTRRPDLAVKVGQSGVEFVHGTYDARCRVLALAGYRLDDPQHILGMDRYELILAANGAGLGGVTANGDTWTGMFSLRR